MKPPIKLQENLVSEMKKKGLNYSQLAGRSQVARSTIHNWASGRMVKDISELKKVAEILETPLYELLFGEPDPHIRTPLSTLSEVFSGEVRLIIEKIKPATDTNSKNLKP